MNVTAPDPLSRGAIWEALMEVYDPELGVDIVNLGLIYDIAADDSNGYVTVEMTLTTPACPVQDQLELATKTVVSDLPGVRHVEVAWTFDPPWSSERITEEGRDALMALGYL